MAMPSVLQAGVDLALGAGHRLDAAEAFQMRAQGVVDQRHIGTGDAGQIG
jgi:hypothetical protein